jgi:hypothetical protein
MDLEKASDSVSSFLPFPAIRDLQRDFFGMQGEPVRCLAEIRCPGRIWTAFSLRERPGEAGFSQDPVRRVARDQIAVRQADFAIISNPSEVVPPPAATSTPAASLW